MTRRALLAATGLGLLAACTKDPGPPTPTPSGVLAPRTSTGPTPTFQIVSRSRTGRVETWQLRSPALPEPFAVRVMLPRSYDAGSRRYPVLYLLHGSSSSSEVTIADGLEGEVGGSDIIVVAPDGGAQGWYVDWAQASPVVHWESFHVRALVPAVDRAYRTLARRSARAVAGISMGGFGAVHYAQAYPDTFAAATSLSGALDLTTPRDFGALDGQDLDGKPAHAILGTNGASLTAWIDPVQHVSTLTKTRVRLYCGDSDSDSTESWVRATAQSFRAACQGAGIDAPLTILPGGHSHEVWGPALAREIPALAQALT